jgi:putative hemolysin
MEVERTATAEATKNKVTIEIMPGGNIEEPMLKNLYQRQGGGTSPKSIGAAAGI